MTAVDTLYLAAEAATEHGQHHLAAAWVDDAEHLSRALTAAHTYIEEMP